MCRVAIPGNLYSGSKVWMTTKFFLLTHFGMKTTDVTSNITSYVILHHNLWSSTLWRMIYREHGERRVW